MKYIKFTNIKILLIIVISYGILKIIQHNLYIDNFTTIGPINHTSVFTQNQFTAFKFAKQIFNYTKELGFANNFFDNLKNTNQDFGVLETKQLINKLIEDLNSLNTDENDKIITLSSRSDIDLFNLKVINEKNPYNENLAIQTARNVLITKITRFSKKIQISIEEGDTNYIAKQIIEFVNTSADNYKAGRDSSNNASILKLDDREIKAILDNFKSDNSIVQLGVLNKNLNSQRKIYDTHKIIIFFRNISLINDVNKNIFKMILLKVLNKIYTITISESKILCDFSISNTIKVIIDFSVDEKKKFDSINISSFECDSIGIFHDYIDITLGVPPVESINTINNQNITPNINTIQDSSNIKHINLILKYLFISFLLLLLLILFFFY